MTDLLLLDSDKQLAPILDEFGAVFGIKAESCVDKASYQSASSGKSFEGYIIINPGDFATAADFLKEEMEAKHTPLALFTEDAPTMSQFLAYRELGIDYIFELPIKQEEVLALFRQMTNQEPPPELALPPPLIEKYTKTTPEKLETLSQLVQEIAENDLDKERLIALRNAVHKIAGSAAAYGYGDAGLLCKAHELYLYDVYSAEEISTPKEEIVKTDEQFLRQVRLAFQHIVAKKAPQVKEAAVKKKVTHPPTA